jgi:serine-type D-Ala-D-Ala carboxypeptidase
VTPETVYDVASLTKVVATTAAAMLLYQRGLLDLDTPAGRIAAGLCGGPHPGRSRAPREAAPSAGAQLGAAGVRGVFSHRDTPARSSAPALNCLLKPNRVRAPSTPIRGSFCWARRWRCMTREYLATWVRREIFEPLGMTATDSVRRPRRVLRFPHRRRQRLRHRRIQGEVQDENAWLLKGAAGHAGLFSNVPDLLRFAAEILKASSERATASEQSGLFDPATVKAFCRAAKPGRQFAGAGLGYAVGEFLCRATLFAAFDRAPGLQRLFALD